jgi:Rer1 family
MALTLVGCRVKKGLMSMPVYGVSAGGPYRIDPSRGPLSYASSRNPVQKMQQLISMVSLAATNLADQAHPYPLHRWLVNALFAMLFMIRIIILQGYYVVAYTLGIYLLSSFLLFLTPKFDPALEMDNDADLDDEGDAGPALPTSADEEFRPFVRRLPEFVFWYVGALSFAYSCLLGIRLLKHSLFQ